MAVALSAILAVAASFADIQLPAPEKTGGKPLMVALSQRKSTRAFSSKSLSTKTLSSLLWEDDVIFNLEQFTKKNKGEKC